MHWRIYEGIPQYSMLKTLDGLTRLGISGTKLITLQLAMLGAFLIELEFRNKAAVSTNCMI
ncbi:hypothetical protein AOT11_21330 [Vibrio vulnificus NBRC 15645 = ATCC 27562]|nr:hypothetical protein AOT11_21330 [Vibrio vulnificus NBRC 15645 = ATCC 27562]HAS8433258.1 hypothetical protein [Vibrio vulnificus]HAS8435215.1 hypothetical protein [Vibrio vulnificus]